MPTYGQGVAELFRVDAEKRGLKILGFEGTGETSNVDPMIASIKTKNADLVYFGGAYDQAGPFFRQARERGVKARFLGAGGMETSDLTKIAGKVVVGMQYVSAAGPASALPKGKQLLEDFLKRFGKDPALYAAEAYDVTAIVLKAIEAATRGGTAPSREEVSAAIRQVRHQGITGDIEFDDRGDRKRALYFVLQVASESPEKWGENPIVKQLTLGAVGR